MTNRTRRLPPPRSASDAQPAGPTDARRSLRRAGMTAGVGILLISVLAGLGKFVALDGLITPGDAAQTAHDITESEILFRLGVMAMFLVAALDVVVAWALYRVFSPVSEGISMLAGWFRLAYAAVFMIAIVQLLGVLRLLGDDYVTVLSTDQRQAQALAGIDAFNDAWNVGLLLFGFHLLALGYLAFRSGFVPKFLGLLLGVAGAGYTFDSLALVLAGGSAPVVSTFTFIGEFLLALWLVIFRGRMFPTG